MVVVSVLLVFKEISVVVRMQLHQTGCGNDVVGIWWRTGTISHAVIGEGSDGVTVCVASESLLWWFL